ncbi:hypothetical protein FAGKG844_80086 [Frankia sp. AgKG'84/4]
MVVNRARTPKSRRSCAFAGNPRPGDALTPRAPTRPAAPAAPPMPPRPLDRRWDTPAAASGNPHRGHL